MASEKLSAVIRDATESGGQDISDWWVKVSELEQALEEARAEAQDCADAIEAEHQRHVVTCTKLAQVTAELTQVRAERDAARLVALSTDAELVAYERGKGDGFDAGFNTVKHKEQRFTAAVAAMRGLLASEEGNVTVSQALMERLAKVSVEYADALLAELAKGEGK